MKTAVLLIIFNRPRLAAQVFQTIRAARPDRLYLAADGPRAERGSAEAELCAAARATVLDNIDWPCEVKTLLSEVNLGCGRGPYNAMRWFFEHETEGIILEDDCLVHPDFFTFCLLMLDKYRNDDKVRAISGTNYDFYPKDDNDSYYFSAIPIIGAWAGWRKTWDGYQFDLAGMGMWRYFGLVCKYFKTVKSRICWMQNFMRAKMELIKGRDRVSYWDYQLVFGVWGQNGLNIVPNRSMSKSISDCSDATHMQVEDPLIEARQLEPILPIKHPEHVIQNKHYDERYTVDRAYWKGMPQSLVKLIVRYGFHQIKRLFR